MLLSSTQLRILLLFVIYSAKVLSFQLLKSNDGGSPFSPVTTYLQRRKIHNLQLFNKNIPFSTAETVEDLKRRLLDGGESFHDNLFACPESLQPLSFSSRTYGLYTESYLSEKVFGAKYKVLPNYIDLLYPEGRNKRNSLQQLKLHLRSSFMYTMLKLGYRQNLELLGFPSIEAEFSDMKRFFESVNAVDTVLELSCGIGLMTQRLLSSPTFSRVIATDSAPIMLDAAAKACRNNGRSPSNLVRCDNAALPFRSNTISSVLASGAMHFWPDTQQSLHEIHRVMKPGGAFYASTITSPNSFFKYSSILKSFGISSLHSAKELNTMMKDAGFTQCQIEQEGSSCVIVKALKAPVDAKMF